MPSADAIGKPVHLTATGTGNNAIATATIVAPGLNARNICVYAIFSMDGTPTVIPLITIKSGSTTLLTFSLPAAAATASYPVILEFPNPLKCGINEAIVATLGALGAGVNGFVSIGAYADSV